MDFSEWLRTNPSGYDHHDPDYGLTDEDLED